jgi:hypothetical protein
MLHLVVVSGLCNRLFAIVSALRYARQLQIPVTIYWKVPVGRQGVAYQGVPQAEHLNCFFQPLPNITLKTWVPNLIEMLQKENANFQIIHDGSLIIPEYMNKSADGQLIFPPNFAQLIQAPLAFPRIKEGIINMPTHPFGFSEDPMHLYRKYPQEVGRSRNKTQYERELSKFARKLQPIPTILNIIRHHQQIFNRHAGTPNNLNPLDPNAIPPPPKPKLGIHIRRTDLKTTVTTQSLDQTMDKYVNQYQNTHSIFLCSDDYNLQHRYVQRYPKARICSYSDVAKTANNLNGAQKALVDLYLLGSCDHILGTKGSSFSYFSWMLASDQTTFEIHS